MRWLRVWRDGQGWWHAETESWLVLLGTDDAQPRDVSIRVAEEHGVSVHPVNVTVSEDGDEAWWIGHLPTPPDGDYLLYPEGSDWEAIRVRDGRVVTTSSAAVRGTHAAAGDDLADLAPSDADQEIAGPVADAVAISAGYLPWQDVRVYRRASWLGAIEAAYRDAQVRWTGLDWTTDHGPWQVDLDGLDADRLREIADRVAAGGEEEEDLAYLPDRIAYLPDRIWSGDRAEIAEWLRDAAEYLDQVATDAAEAEEAGQEAIESVRQGDLDEALRHAERACRIEARYGDCPVWGGLRDAIRQAIEERDAADV